jgi:primary-amine oxidase
MPTDYAKFSLKPYGFFGKNPALNIPPNQAAGHCNNPTAGEAHGCHS